MFKESRGERGVPGVSEFDPTGVYPTGTAVSFAGQVWQARIDLNGRQILLINPFEGDEWTALATVNFLVNLPGTRSYRIANQADFDLIQPLLAVGDSVTSRVDIDLIVTDNTGQHTVTQLGAPIRGGTTDLEYVITELKQFADGRYIVNLGSDQGRSAADLESGYRNAIPDFAISSDMTFGAPNLTDPDGLDPWTKLWSHETDFVFTGVTKRSFKDDTQFSINQIPSPNGNPASLDVFEKPPYVGGVNILEEFEVGTRLYGDEKPGILFDSVLPAQIGDRLSKTVGGVQTSSLITEIYIEDGVSRIFVEDFRGFGAGDVLFVQSVTIESLTRDHFYIRTDAATFDETKLEPLTADIRNQSDFSINDSSDPLFIKNKPTVTSDQGLVTGAQRRSIVRFEGSEVFTDDRRRQVSIAYNKLFGSHPLLYPPTSLELDGADIQYPAIEDGAQVNIIDEVDGGDFLLDGDKRLTLDSRIEGGELSAEKILRLTSSGVIAASVFGQINLSSVTPFATRELRNASIGRNGIPWISGDTTIITGDPLVTDPFIGTFTYQGADQTVAGVTIENDWIEIQTPTGAVASVAGKSGVVTLSIEDIANLVVSLGGKVDKVLDTNGAELERLGTVAEFQKLDEATEGAEVNVQADWKETDKNSDAYIIDAPENVENGAQPNVIVSFEAEKNNPDGSTNYSFIDKQPTIPSIVGLASETLANSKVPKEPGFSLIKDRPAR